MSNQTRLIAVVGALAGMAVGCGNDKPAQDPSTMTADPAAPSATPPADPTATPEATPPAN